MQRATLAFPLVILLVFAALGAQLGQGAPPGPPVGYYGTITMTDGSDPAGYNLVACVNGCDASAAGWESQPVEIRPDGSYIALIVGPPDGSFSGRPITFWIVNLGGRIQATESVNLNSSPPLFREQNLTFMDALPVAPVPTPVPPTPVPATPVPTSEPTSVPPTPVPTPEPTPVPPTPVPTPEPTPEPTPVPPTATPEPTPTPTPEPTATPQPTATPEPTATTPPPANTPTPEATATPEPTPTPEPEGEEGGGTNIFLWLFIGLVVFLVGGGTLVFVFRNRILGLD